METERRERLPAVPEDLPERLTADQALRLRQMEGFGWRVAFVRRPLFKEITVVLSNGDGSQVGILEPDGELNLEVGQLQVRRD